MIRAIDKVAKWLGYEKTEVRRDNGFARSFAAAITGRLTQDWAVSNQSADAALRYDVKTMRDRARDLERSENYIRRYLKLLENNVLGANGVQLQMKIKEYSKGVESFDRVANSIIERSFEKWGRREFCTVTKMYDWAKIQSLALRSCARDGGALFRKHYPNDNPFSFALEPMEIDHLDQDFNGTSGGVVVKMGVEYNASGAVSAYHILRTHPGDNYQYVSSGRYRERVPANDVIHLFMPERFGQSCGAPWVHPAIIPLRHLAKYSEAEVVAARASAAKMGFLVPKDSASAPGYVGPDDGNGNKYMDVEPGSIEQLPFGYDFQQFDPSHPNSAFGAFVKSQLREISAGLGVSYVSLANDLEAVNYSSIRAGLIEEREEWKSVQRWFIESFVRPVFEDWLRYALMAGAVTDGTFSLPAAKFDKFNQPEFKPRRWAWVDPLKDMQAEVLAVEKGWKSKRSSISEAGGDIEDVYQEQAADDALADEYGLDFDAVSESANAAPSKPKGSNDTALTDDKE